MSPYPRPWRPPPTVNFLLKDIQSGPSPKQVICISKMLEFAGIRTYFGSDIDLGTVAGAGLAFSATASSSRYPTGFPLNKLKCKR
ncbi:uncharacterized protein ARMOST_12112 [Armillaria ostoyae]|uniref:Uncharacterized protein n=1 Tax=Armillaria ostoyae TaxID=47428 RepID=A0A284RJ25_ARMOS|nr:uncharacterized protein ARMOST_12112 [Armillaria ostoyae]